jgi:hypothetical protein
VPDQLTAIVGRMVAAGESEENIAAVIRQMSTPAVSHEAEPRTTTDLVEQALRSKGVEMSPESRQMNERMAEGAMGGGVTSAAPGAATGGVKVLQGLGKRLYSGLLKPSKAVKQEFGDVVPGLLEKRRLITRGGAEAAEGAVEQSAKVADDMIANAPKPSPGVSARRVVQEFRPVKDAVQARVDAGVSPASELSKVTDRAKRIRGTARQSGGRIDPQRAQTLKRTSQDAAQGAYRQMERGNAKMLGTDDLLDAATARGFKGGLEDIVPGIGAQNQATQRLIGESRALTDAVGRTSNHLPFGSVSDLAAMGAGMANPALGIAGKLSTMAGPGSAIAVLMNEVGKRGMDDAMQRALMVAMSQGSHQQ